MRIFLTGLILPLLFFCFMSSTLKALEPNLNTNQSKSISQSTYVASGLFTSLTVGGGIGHAMQGRWQEKGWIFTSALVGLPALAALVSGSSEGAVLGFALWIPFHIWEIADIWIAPTVGEVPSLAYTKQDFLYEKNKLIKPSNVEFQLTLLSLNF